MQSSTESHHKIKPGGNIFSPALHRLCYSWHKLKKKKGELPGIISNSEKEVMEWELTQKDYES